MGNSSSNSSSSVRDVRNEGLIGSCRGAEDFMGHSHPYSPKSRAAQIPLLFTPQMPMTPLKRSEEIRSPSNSPMQNSFEDENFQSEQGIPTMITWSYGGKEVFLEGSWDNWKTKKPLQRVGKEHTIMKVLPTGFYHYRFIVDGELKYAPDVPWIQDDIGNAYNILDVQEFVPENLGSIAGFDPPQSPESSYTSWSLASEDYTKEPPLLPPHLQLTILNSPFFMNNSSYPLCRPPHVVLNHLYIQKAKNGQAVVALGGTQRFHAKYVTTIFYKSLRR